jgi:plasmid rolling circle replication initiator protein Rep
MHLDLHSCLLVMLQYVNKNLSGICTLKNHAEIFRVVTNIHMIRISHKNTLIDRHDMNEGREKTLGR